MNNKAFTLIELTAVIVVLALIFLVTFPNILNLGRDREKEKYDKMVEDLCIAGESYIYANIDVFDELSTVGSKIEIPIKDLMIYGNVDKDLKNPKNNASIENHTLIYNVLYDNSLSCEYKEN